MTERRPDSRRATSTSLPTAAEMSDLLSGLQERFDWETRESAYEITAHWQRRSGAAFYRVLGSPAEVDLVVKVDMGWQAGGAERMFRSMIELEELIGREEVEGWRAIRPMGWADDPPAIVMPHVAGLDLVSILRDPSHRAWGSDQSLLRAWIGGAGGMLAAYHRSGGPCLPDELEVAGGEVLELARRMRIRSSSISRIMAGVDWRHRCAGLFRDFGPGNFIGAPDGTLYLLDPPDGREPGLIHRDIGNFLFEMRRQLAGHGYTNSRPVRGRFTELRTAFLDGYVAESAHGGFGGDDEALIALFELRRAAGMARKRWPERPRDALWFGGSALRRRLELVRSRA
jgi:hypothetical protein